MKHTNTDYWRGLRQRDDTILREIYREFAPGITQWVKRNSGSVADAQDLFQEVLTHLFLKSEDEDFCKKTPFEAILIRMCKFRWIDQLRKKKQYDKVRKAETDRYTNEYEADISQQLIAVEQSRQRDVLLQKTFLQLSETCQQLLRLFQQGLKPAAIAQQMDMPKTSTVYRRKNACIDRWRTLLQEQGS